MPKISFDSDFVSFLDEGPFTPIKMQPGEPAMFLYTSGSTGRPKGVVLSHYSHLWAISQRVRRPVPPGQRSLVAAPLYHMNGLAMCQTTLHQGDTIVLLPQFTTKGYIEAAARQAQQCCDHRGGHEPIEPIHEAAVARNELAGVLGPETALDGRFQQIPRLRGQ